MLTARRLGKRYGEKRVLRRIDLALPRGGFLVVTGPNGSGKTTLLRICAGLAQPTEGTIERSATRAQVGYLGHEPLVYRELTALENLDSTAASIACRNGASGSACCSSGSGSGRCGTVVSPRIRAA